MSTALERTIQALEHVVKQVPIGTNLALLHLLWAMLNGSFLRSRGAVFPALQLAGFTTPQIRRSGQALRCGAWDIDELLQPWRDYVLRQGQWQPHRYEGYSPLAVDLTAFWRPRLRGRLGKFFHRIANRAMKGIGLGLVAQIGHVGEQRIPLLKHIICARKSDMSESQFRRRVLQIAGRGLGEDEVLVHDGGASIADMQAAKIERYVVRMALNCTARRNRLPPRKARGRRPEYGELIRPLPRKRKGRTIPATPPDVKTHFWFEGRIIRVYGWRDLVRSDQKVAADNERIHSCKMLPKWYNSLK